MKLAALFSGGKDSTYALFKEMQNHSVVCLISILSENTESYMFHTPNIHLVELQAKAIGLPLILKKTKGIKEEELEDLKEAIKEAKEKYRIEGIVTGALYSNYQKGRIEKICDELKLKCLNPLWHMNQIELLNEIIENNFKVIISGIFAYPLDEKWLGKIIDKGMIDNLAKLQEKYKLNPAGEGGEIETTVLDAPFFKNKIEILQSEIKAKGNEGIFIVHKAKLSKK